MPQFDCYEDICHVASQFCETVSEKCRNCKDYTGYCFINNKHISNCSTYCYDMLMKNMSLHTNSSMGRCATPDDDNFSELHHLLIESFLVFIIIGIVVVICVFRCQLLPDILRRISPCTEPKSVAADEKIELSVMQPFMPQGKDCQATVGDPQVSNCGFTKHNQIPNSRKDDPSLCLSGRRENHDQTIT